jgi:gas vesicle protein
MLERNNNLLKGLLAGGLIGMALGILFAPKSGKETREKIARKADELLVKAKEEYGKTFEKGKTSCDASVNNSESPETSAKGDAAEVESKVSEIAHQSTEAVKGNKNRLKMAIEAGLQAYREEINKKTV